MYTTNATAAPPSPPICRRGHSRTGSNNHHGAHGHTRSHSNNSSGNNSTSTPNFNYSTPNTPNTPGTPPNINTTENSSTKRGEKLELIVFVSDLLSYVGVLFSRHNTMVLDGFLNLLLHSTHKVKGHYRMSRSSFTNTSAATSSSTTSSDSTNTDSPCEGPEDKSTPTNTKANEPSGTQNQERNNTAKLESEERIKQVRYRFLLSSPCYSLYVGK